MTSNQKVVNRCVLRLTTTYAKHGNGCTQFKSIRFLNKFCSGYNVLEESIGTDGLDPTMDNVINLNEVPDGIYECRAVNETYDREYGELLDFDFQLFPYMTEQEFMEQEQCLQKRFDIARQFFAGEALNG